MQKRLLLLSQLEGLYKNSRNLPYKTINIERKTTGFEGPPFCALIKAIFGF